jgi:hypothetical protein
MTSPKNPNNSKHLPSTNKDGTIHAGSGIGPVKNTAPNRPWLEDLKEASERGILPVSGLSFDTSDENSLANVGYRKFSPERKQVYLETLAKTGRSKLAALVAGVTPTCVADHASKDPDFAQQREIAQDTYHEITAALILAQAREGMKDIRYDKEGNITSMRTSYETRLREKMLNRADPTYIETQKSEVAVTGGAVVVPAPIDSVDTWEATVAKYTGRTVETTGQAVEGKALPEDSES